MSPIVRMSCLGLVAITCVSVAGCGGSQTTASNPPSKQQDHDHASHGDEQGHAHPESFAEAVTEVEELCAAIKTAFAADKLEEADGPVHEICHLVEELPALAAKESLSAADQQQIKQSVDALMDSFAALDERVHGGDSAGKSYDEVAAQIDSALAELKSIGKEESHERFTVGQASSLPFPHVAVAGSCVASRRLFRGRSAPGHLAAAVGAGHRTGASDNDRRGQGGCGRESARDVCGVVYRAPFAR